MAPAGLNILPLLIAIALAVVAGALLALVDTRRNARTTPHIASQSDEVAESRRRAA